MKVVSPQIPQLAPNRWRHIARVDSRLVRVLVVVLGILAGQIILYGPSLAGARILLPVDLLVEGGMYHSSPPATPGVDYPHDLVPRDLVTFQEPERRFANQEFAAGRFPLWTPHRFAGAPLYRLSFSPFWMLGYWVESPSILAWIQVLIALTAGLGLYAFCRRVLGVSFWPGAIVAWCYPLTGAFILWQGFYFPAVFCWLPWILWGLDAAVRRPQGPGAPALAFMVTIVLISGALDIAVQVMAAAALFLPWSIFDHFRKERAWPKRVASVAVVAIACNLGIAGSAWLMLPLDQYVQEGVRMQQRWQGAMERPPAGLAALPQVVAPKVHGDSTRGNVRLANDVLPESSAGAYAGLVATLFLAPLAWLSRRHRAAVMVLSGMILISLGWTLDLPGLVHLLRLPMFNMLSHNRWVFVAGFGILALASVGMEQLWQGGITGARWFAVPAGVAFVMMAWCTWRALAPPDSIARLMEGDLPPASVFSGVWTMEDARQAQRHFRKDQMSAAGFALVTVVGWWAVRRRRGLPKAALAVAPAVLLGELLLFGVGRAAQCDPGLYFPRIPALARFEQETPGRVVGLQALPPNLSQMTGLADVRGYDAIDPASITELLLAASLPHSSPPYARTQYLAPLITVDAQGQPRFPPILDMLNVRYGILRTPPAPPLRAAWSGDDYWIVRNPRALPRAFVPERVAIVADARLRLEQLAREDFDPRKIAYAEHPVEGVMEDARGQASIREETPTRLILTATMETKGLLVVADRWDPGWVAALNDTPLPVLRVNHALRGLSLPAGEHTITLEYAPMRLRYGTWLSGFALFAVTQWLLAALAAPGSRLTASSGVRPAPAW